MKPCTYFPLGQCRFGAGCRFSHDVASVQGAPARNVARLRMDAGATPADPRIADQGFRKQLTRETMGAALVSPQPAKSPSMVPCRFYKAGACRNGAECSFAHSEAPKASDTWEQDENDISFNEHKRDLGSSLVEFGPGASVTRVSLIEDFSAIRINRLPSESSVDSVVGVLSTMGQTVAPSSVRVVRTQSDGTVAADITLEDPKFADGIYHAWLSTPLDELRRLDLKKVTPYISVNANSRRVERRKIQCSWFKPSRRARLSFEDQNVAERVFGKFERQIYQLSGRKVTCTEPRRSGDAYGFRYWNVMIRDLPSTISKPQIMSMIKVRSEKPDDVFIGDATYEIDGEEACAIVLSLLSKQGTIEWGQANTELDGKRAKAVARYSNESDALDAERLLNGEILPFGSSLKLDVQLLSTAKFRVRPDVFKIVQEQIRAASSNWKSQGTSLKVYPPATPTSPQRVVRIEGQSQQHVAAAKEQLDKILDGTVLKDDQGKPFWNPSLQSRGSGLLGLKDIGKENGVLITIDQRLFTVSAVGPDKNIEAARRAVAQEMSKSASTNPTISLTPDAFIWACQGGFRSILDGLGPDIVAFDITAKMITVRGSDQDFEKAMRMVQKRQPVALMDDPKIGGACPICFTDAEQPVRVSCGDTYCGECFEGLCAAARDGDFPVHCQGDGGQCQTVFPLQELQESLPSRQFEDMLHASFDSYIRRHPQEFGFCAKPDCDTIYRKNTENRMHTCAKCFTVTCTHCHAQHDRETCADYFDRTTGATEATERVKRQLGIKDCPECKTPIEKVDGCNHVECRGCRTHICWVCLDHFPGGPECYKHMSEKHGGVFDYGLRD